MVSFEQFLLTADADHVIATQQANDYTTTEPVFITSNTLTVYVVQKSLYAFLSDQSLTGVDPLRSICMALMDRLRGVSEFNLSANLPLGQANRQMLDALIAGFAESHPVESQKLAELKIVLEGISDREVKPFANRTLHDTRITRKDCPVADVVVNGRYAVITVTTDCPLHNPRLLAQSPAGVWRRVNNFEAVSAAGVYDCLIPAEVRGLPLKVDDAYGVI